MTEAELAEIEARAAKATQGPWTQGAEFREGKRHEIWGAHGSCLIAKMAWGSFEPSERMVADAELIAHAREDVPKLIAEIRRLKERDRALARAIRNDELVEDPP